jgi:hypothetical protein
VLPAKIHGCLRLREGLLAFPSSRMHAALPHKRKCLFPAILDTVLGHIADRLDFVDFAHSDLKYMSGGQIEGAIIIRHPSNSQHSFDLHHLRYTIMDEHRESKYQSHFLICGDQPSLIDMRDMLSLSYEAILNWQAVGLPMKDPDRQLCLLLASS